MTSPATVWVREPHLPPPLRPAPPQAPALYRRDVGERLSVNEAAVSALVGKNLRRLRKQQRLSLEQLSAFSGVSRAMLGQVEQGKSVPSIKTLWQVAQALGVSVSWFLDAAHEGAALLLQPPADSQLHLKIGEGELRPLQPAEDGQQDTFYELRLAPGAVLKLPLAATSRRVNVVVSAGVLDVVLEDVRHLLRPRDALQYEASGQLLWRNSGQVQVQAFVVLRALTRTG